MSEWLAKLRDHVNEVGTDQALAALGAEQAGAGTPLVQYEGGWESPGDFVHSYLGRHGIAVVGDAYGNAGDGSGAANTVDPTKPVSD